MINSTDGLLSIVVPAYNEEKNLEPTIVNLTKASHKLKGSYEIIVVDDNSTDQTESVARRLEQKYPSVRLIKNTVNLGFGGAYKRGVENARLSYVLMVPGDDAYPISSLERIFEKVGSADIVMSYTSNLQVRSFGRRLISKGFVHIMNLLFGLRLKYYNGVSVLPTTTAQNIKFSSGFSYAAENLVRLIKLRGFTYEQVPCEITERKDGKSSALRLKNIWSVFSGVSKLLVDVYCLSRFKTKPDMAKEDQKVF